MFYFAIVYQIIKKKFKKYQHATEPALFILSQTDL